MKFNRAEMARAAKLLAKLDERFRDPAVQSETIWRGDARAVRYVLRKFMTQVGYHGTPVSNFGIASTRSAAKT